MCTMNFTLVPLSGTASRAGGWLRVSEAVVACDHPVMLTCEHAVLIDLRDAAGPHAARVSIELEIASAESLARAILSALSATGAAVQATGA